MQVDPSDVRQTLEYRMDATLADWLPLGLLTIFCGLFLFAMEAPYWPEAGESLGAGAAIAVGIGLAAIALWRCFRRGSPVYVLSPGGIHIRPSFAREIFIPWREVKGVKTTNLSIWHRWTRHPRQLNYDNVTVALVSLDFYDEHINVASPLLRGPYWSKLSFIAVGEMIQCALHPELVSADPLALRKAVEARWLAFRDKPIPSVPPTSRAVAAAGLPKPITPWQAVKIGVPLVGIVVVATNLLGLWATQGQIEAYESKREWEEMMSRYEADRKAHEERMKAFDKEMEETFRELERSFDRY